MRGFKGQIVVALAKPRRFARVALEVSYLQFFRLKDFITTIMRAVVHNDYLASQPGRVLADRTDTSGQTQRSSNLQ